MWFFPFFSFLKPRKKYAKIVSAICEEEKKSVKSSVGVCDFWQAGCAIRLTWFPKGGDLVRCELVITVFMYSINFGHMIINIIISAITFVIIFVFIFVIKSIMIFVILVTMASAKCIWSALQWEFNHGSLIQCTSCNTRLSVARF